MQLSLRDAAQHIGTTKSTVWRAIRAGRLSATRKDDGEYQIDPAELMRVYPPDRLVPRNELRPATNENEVEIRIRNAGLEAEIKALREIVEMEKRRSEEIRIERDQWRSQADNWRGQAEKLLLAAPIVPPPPAPTAATPAPPIVVTPPPPRTPWWGWWRHAS